VTVAADAVWVLQLGPALPELARLYPWMTDVAAAARLPAPLLAGIRVALEEVVSNVARHGFAPGADGEIVVTFRCEPGGWVLEVSDNGTAFDPTGAPARARGMSLLDDEVGGWGLGLIRHYCKDIAYAHVGGLNRLTLRFTQGA